MSDFEWDPGFQLGPESAAIAQKVWPRYLCEESDLPQPSLRLEIDEKEFRRRFPAWGLRTKADGRLAAYANAVLLAFDAARAPLPAEGWQFAIEAGARAAKPDCLCLLIANVDPSVQNQRLSSLLLEKAKAEARAAGLAFVIGPVRPSHRHTRPELSFEAYVNLRRADGLFFDPWMRAHARAGGEQRELCARSAVVTASVGKWREWTGEKYPESGNYPLERGLAPLAIDLARDVGTYVEPNVWFRYKL